MSERLKRRKKEPEKTAGPATPAPLQPEFYDVEAPSVSSPAPTPIETNEAVPEPARRQRPAPQPRGQERPQEHAQEHEQPRELQEAPSAQPQQPRSGDDARAPRRRRRGRGGRGRARGGPRPAAPAQGNQTPLHPVAASRVSEPSAQIAAATMPPRASRGEVVLAIGLPGSGKSSWFKRHEITPLSSDMLRSLLFDDPTEQRFQDLIFSNLRSMLKARLIARRPTNYVDATNLTPHERANWIKLAKDYGYEAQAVFFDVPVEVCLERNLRRQRVVPEDVMRRMAAKLRPPSFQEGFAKITVVKVKKKEEPAAS
jgi:predicted kinase